MSQASYHNHSFTCEPEEVDDIIIALNKMGFSVIERSANASLRVSIEVGVLGCDLDKFALAVITHGDLRRKDGVRIAIANYFSDNF